VGEKSSGQRKGKVVCRGGGGEKGGALIKRKKGKRPREKGEAKPAGLARKKGERGGIIILFSGEKKKEREERLPLRGQQKLTISGGEEGNGGLVKYRETGGKERERGGHPFLDRSLS